MKPKQRDLLSIGKKKDIINQRRGGRKVKPPEEKLRVPDRAVAGMSLAEGKGGSQENLKEESPGGREGPSGKTIVSTCARKSANSFEPQERARKIGKAILACSAKGGGEGGTRLRSMS